MTMMAMVLLSQFIHPLYLIFDDLSGDSKSLVENKTE